MPPLNQDTIASELGLIFLNAIKAKERELNTLNSKGTNENIFNYLHEEDFEDVITDASDKASEWLKEHLCTFRNHPVGDCDLCK